MRIKLISCFVNKQLFVRRAILMCSSASSLVLFTTVLELPLTMVLATVVLLAVDRRLLRKWRVWGGEGDVAWASLSNGRFPSGVGEVRSRVLPACSTGFFCLCPYSRLFLFPSFPELYHTSPYSDFRVYPSDLQKCPWFRVKLRHDLVCITMPWVCVNPFHDLVCNKCP